MSTPIRVAFASDYDGWVRTTALLPPIPAGRALRWVDGTLGVPGRRITHDGAQVIDLRVSGRARMERSYDWPAAEGVSWAIGALPADSMEFFGIPTLDGDPLQVSDVGVDGAAYAACIHGQSLLHAGWHFRAWLRWYPDRANSLQGTCIVTAGGTDPVRSAATLAFRWIGQTWMMGVSRLAHGQEQRFFIEPSGVAVVGATPWPEGFPLAPAAFDSDAWADEHRRDDMADLQIGIAKASGVTGAQEDFLWPGRETTSPRAAVVRRSAAHRHGMRPCHLLDERGEQIEPGVGAGVGLRLWDGRPSWDRRVSPNQLGLPRPLTTDDTGGWWGPDVEHWSIGSLCVVWRQFGDPADQWELRQQALLYLGQYTAEPGVATSQAYAARARGYEALNLVRLHANLQDRALVWRCLQRWKDRWALSIDAACPAGGEWDVRVDDPRLGRGQWWMPWQESVAVYGLYRIGKLLKMQAVVDRAVERAREIVATAWRLRDGRWQSAPVMPVGASDMDSGTDFRDARAWLHRECGIPMPQTETDAPFDGFDETFNAFGMPLSAAVVRLADPADVRAASILAQLARYNADSNWLPLEMGWWRDSTWLPPEVR